MRALHRQILSFCLLSLPIFFHPHTALANPLPQSQNYSQFNGKQIGKITVHINEIFDEKDASAIYHLANGLKINTKERVVRQELLLTEGGTFDDFALRESERNLRTLGFLRDVVIEAKENGDKVDLEVRVRDTWTIIPQFSFTSGTGDQKMAAGIAESNLMGLGKRVEFLYAEDNNRQSFSGLYDDNRVWGTYNRLLAARFQRNDGHETLMYFGKPFRTLLDKTSWETELDASDTIGRLFQNGDERFIFRREHVVAAARFGYAKGDPKQLVQRYTLGYRYEEDTFSMADPQDYSDLDLDPSLVSQDPELLAENRRYTGPTLTYKDIEPNFITMSYIDRFDRVADYNLGPEFSVTGFFAPELIGSNDDAIIFSLNRAQGYKFSPHSFIRGEIGAGSRAEEDGLLNSLFRTEVKYYNVLGLLELGSLSLGRHTLAAGFSLDYGYKLDNDREFLLGADNGLRGYDAKTYTGDKRLLLNLEDRVHFIDDAFQLVSIGGAAFIDAGGSTRESIGNLFGDHFFTNVGVGLRIAFPRSTGSRVLRVDLAFPLRDGPDGTGAFEPRLILSGGQVFNSFLRSETDGPEQASVGIGFDR